MTNPEERPKQQVRGLMEFYKNVKSYLAFTCPHTFPRLTITNGRIATQAGLYSNCKSDRVQSTLRETTRMGFIQLPIIDWMPFPPHFASYSSQYVARSHMSSLVHAGYP